LHDRLRRLTLDRERNFGFEKVERLAGNVGYVELVTFAGPWDAQATAVAAMALLAHTDAVIFDLRANGGGSPGMVQFLCSYLFDERTHLNSLYFREGDRTQEFWTHDVPGTKLPDVPVFVLTSARTFSAAEEFSYNLRTRSRATLVGETTRGGANPGGLFPIDAQFEIVIPTGRAINPVTGGNWEGIGVEPHVSVAADSALEAALELARPAAAAHRALKLAQREALEASYFEALRLADAPRPEEAARALCAGLRVGLDAHLLAEDDVDALGRDLLRQERHALAVAALSFNVATFPTSASALVSLGAAQAADGELTEAIASYGAALELDPTGRNAAAARTKLSELQSAVKPPDGGDG
jgi:hypothetical protein